MSSLLRRALEQESLQEEQTIEMKGPLAEVYTQALNEAYAKKDDPALESQAIDAMIAQSLAKFVAPEEKAAPNVTIYGVSENDLTEQDVVNVTSDLAAADDGTDFYMIIDATQPSVNGEQNSAPAERLVQLGQALESIVLAMGGKVCHSLGEFAQMHSK